MCKLQFSLDEGRARKRGEKRYCRNVEVGRVEVGMGGDRGERSLEESARREEEGGGEY